MEDGNVANLGMHIANRLVEIGCNDCFAVPGDFNLLLLDQLLKQPKLNMVWCCNELNAGYAADGYGRKKGIACCCVTYCVGGFSVINAIAGAYSEDVPIIVISGGPNTNDFATNHVLHHTTGLHELGQQIRAFREVTCYQCIIQHISEAHRLIDEAISECVLKRKPVYIEVSCNIADLCHPSFHLQPVPYMLRKPHTNQSSLEGAVEEAVAILSKAVKPVILVGVRTRLDSRKSALLRLADASHYAVAIMPDAKGMFPESYSRFMGLYWGAVSSTCVCEIVESADIVITVGAVWTDYTTVGYSLLLNPNKVIKIEESRVTVCNHKTFGCVEMGNFLDALAAAVPKNDVAWTAFSRMYVPVAEPPTQPPGELLHTNVLFKHIQHFLDSDTSIVCEVGDSWFNGQKLKLPDGCLFEIQMRYGSIGWSVGAALGNAVANKGSKRVLAFIGDGSFQMTAQEVSTMLRYGLNPVIILINNGGYTIEVEIHDGPYNVIKNWNYTGFAEALDNGEGKVWTTKAKTEEQLIAALKVAKETTDKLCFVEVMVDKDDCSKELLEWGSRVASANSRRPNPQ